ncbi:MAG: hypothetical protein LBH10_02155 [Burkholderiaceae bacterium]|jgi:hypothetical protein|nr:hypothetical protein [Burkholderiaceae bacterium]
MNQHLAPIIAARALAAALLLLAALAASAALADGMPTPPASAPATTGIPAAFQGKWTPISNDLAMTSPLILSAHTLRWPNVCGKAARRIKRVTDSKQLAAYSALDSVLTDSDSISRAADHMPQVLIDLTVHGALPCHFYGQRIIHLRLKLGDLVNPSDVCDMEVTFYGYGPQPGGGPWTGPKYLSMGTLTARQFQLNKPIPTMSATCPQAAAASAASGAASSAVKAGGQ